MRKSMICNYLILVLKATHVNTHFCMKNCLLQIFEDEKMITQRKVMILLKMFKHVCDAAEYEKYHVGSP